MKNIRKLFTSCWFWLTLIILVAALLRLWQLGSVPISPDWDEAALGYNAFSILHTARDEYGKFLPVVFRSFDDYKPGLYIYLIVPFIQLFGLSLWVVRLPSAIFGTLTVLGLYFLVKQLIDNKKIALISAGLLAISPWSIQFSHAAFEANVGVAFNVFAVLFFLKALKKQWYIFPSVLFIVASMYVYQSDKLFAPLLYLACILVYRKQVFAVQKKYIILAVIWGCILSLPLISYTLTNKDVFARAQGVSIFAESTQTLADDSQRLLIDRSHHDYLGLVVDNRRLVFAKEIIGNYLSHFDFNWLFITGDISRHHAPGMGLMYLVELPFLLLGIYFLLFGKFSPTTKWLIISWFLLAPVPASVTTGVPHAIRTINFLPMLQIFTAIGLFYSLEKIYSLRVSLFRIKLSYLVFVLILVAFIFNFSYYINQYFVQQTYYTAIDWQYGYALVIPKVQSLETKYKKIIVDNQPYMDQSYIFFLFYLKYPPQQYQEESAKASGGFRENHTFGKFQFRPIDWNKEEKSSDILYVGRAGDFPAGANKIMEITFPDGSPAMDLVQG